MEASEVTQPSENPIQAPNYRIAVVGSGAVGCYYGGRLALHGHDVHFLMRRDLNHVAKHGLKIHSHRGDFHLSDVRAHASTQSIGPCDLVLIALKVTDNDVLLELLPPLLKSSTLLLTLQNGLGIEPWLAEHFGAERVLGGLCFVCINRTGPGQIEHFSQGAITLGDYSGSPQRRTYDIAALLSACEIECTVAENLIHARWRKLLWNIPFNGLAIAGGGIDVAQILSDPDLKTLVRLLMDEILAVAQTLGHDIPYEFIDDLLARTAQMGAYKPSSLLDYLAGRPVEVEPIWGEPYRQGAQAGANTQRLEMLYFLLKSQLRHSRPLK